MRLGEFDLGGVLYHANYFHLLEAAREAFLRENGTPYHSLVAERSHLAVVESHQEFRAPVRYGEQVEIALSFSEIRRVSAIARYELRVGDKLVHTASTKLVFVKTDPNAGTLQPAALPERITAGMKRFEAPTPSLRAERSNPH